MLAHAGYSLFVVWGLVIVIAGMLLRWTGRWFRWFRLSHLVATFFVVVRVWTAWPCPFSAAEDRLRRNDVDVVSTPCPFGTRFHEVFHHFAFRGKDPRRFARSTTWFGAAVLAVFLLSRAVQTRNCSRPAQQTA